MSSSTYDFRNFQEELAALERGTQEKPLPPATDRKARAAERMRRLREDFNAFRERHGLSLAEVVSFFTEEEGVLYLKTMIATADARPRRGPKPRNPPP